MYCHSMEGFELLFFFVHHKESVTCCSNKHTSISQLIEAVDAWLVLTESSIVDKAIGLSIIAVKSLHRSYPQPSFSVIKETGGGVEAE